MNNLHARAGLDDATKELLVDAELVYVKKLKKQIPIVIEWQAHFSTRDTMQAGLQHDVDHPAPRVTYVISDYQDWMSSFEALKCLILKVW